jgi:hypothetical protein
LMFRYPWQEISHDSTHSKAADGIPARPHHIRSIISSLETGRVQKESWAKN